MKDSLRLSAIIPAPPEAVYRAWLDGKQHGTMTGAKATSQARVGGEFTAWDGYIRGQHEELVPPRRIVQSWRTTEFPEDAADSRLEVEIEPNPGGTRLTLVQTELPPGEAERYEVGWRQFYFEPMQRYFSRLRALQAAAQKAREVRQPSPKAAAKPGSAARRRATEKAKQVGKSPAKTAAKKPASASRRRAAKPAKPKRRQVRGRK